MSIHHNLWVPRRDKGRRRCCSAALNAESAELALNRILFVLRRKTPQTVSRLGRYLPVAIYQFYSVDGSDFEQIVFAVLLGEEKHGPVFPEFSGPD